MYICDIHIIHIQLYIVVVWLLFAHLLAKITIYRLVIEQNHYQPSKAIEKASNGPGNVMELL